MDCFWNSDQKNLMADPIKIFIHYLFQDHVKNIANKVGYRYFFQILFSSPTFCTLSTKLQSQDQFS